MWLILSILALVPITISVVYFIFNIAKKYNKSVDEYLNNKHFSLNESYILITISIIGLSIFWPLYMSMIIIIYTANKTIKKLEESKIEW